MEERCKNCRHWEKIVPYDRDPEFQMRSERVAARHGLGVCHKLPDGARLLVKEDAEIDSVLNETPAYTMDGSGYRAELITGPEFGCIQFDPKD